MENILAAVIGAIVGAMLGWFIDRRLMKQKLKEDIKMMQEKHKQELITMQEQLEQASKKHLLDEMRLDLAKELLQFLSMVLNRAAPSTLTGKVPELKDKWHSLNRHLYLLNAPETQRNRFDERMIQYLNSLAALAKDPASSPDVELQRGLAKQEARELVQRLGLAADW